MPKETKAEKADRLSEADKERRAEIAESLRDAVREDTRAKEQAEADAAKPKPTVTRVSVIEDGHTVVKDIEK